MALYPLTIAGSSYCVKEGMGVMVRGTRGVAMLELTFLIISRHREVGGYEHRVHSAPAHGVGFLRDE